LTQASFNIFAASFAVVHVDMTSSMRRIVLPEIISLYLEFSLKQPFRLSNLLIRDNHACLEVYLPFLRISKNGISYFFEIDSHIR
jgi:hypothetical protein